SSPSENFVWSAEWVAGGCAEFFICQFKFGSLSGARKSHKQPGDEYRARCQHHQRHHGSIGRDADEREYGQADIDQEHASDDLVNLETVVGRPLVEMRAMRLPERLASDDAPRKRDCCVGKIV